MENYSGIHNKNSLNENNYYQQYLMNSNIFINSKGQKSYNQIKRKEKVKSPKIEKTYKSTYQQQQNNLLRKSVEIQEKGYSKALEYRNRKLEESSLKNLSNIISTNNIAKKNSDKHLSICTNQTTICSKQENYNRRPNSSKILPKTEDFLIKDISNSNRNFENLEKKNKFKERPLSSKYSSNRTETQFNNTLFNNYLGKFFSQSTKEEENKKNKETNEKKLSENIQVLNSKINNLMKKTEIYGNQKSSVSLKKDISKKISLKKNNSNLLENFVTKINQSRVK